jgi:hypothetical protein
MKNNDSFATTRLKIENISFVKKGILIEPPIVGTDNKIINQKEHSYFDEFIIIIPKIEIEGKYSAEIAAQLLKIFKSY